MPDWLYPSLDGEGSIGSEQLRGRPYLLDVWSTYCSPCVQDMKYLHEAHAALAGADSPITFVALSIDETREAVDEFRREQWPMPWANAWVPPAERDALHETWRFSGIPLTVLVDGEGTIVALTESLRGDALLPTLQAFLNRTASAR
jgi:thiol-disulfide isomerase/thioredoxin